MACDDHMEMAEGGSGAPGRHEPVSRRSILRTAAGAGAAGLVASTALTAIPAAAATRRVKPARPDESAHPTTPSASGDTASTEHIVVHVRDLHTGDMDIVAGTSKTRLRDPALAARLAQASR
jgi:hypothetical protein